MSIIAGDKSSSLMDIASLDFDQIESLRILKRPKRYSSSDAATRSLPNAVLGFPRLPGEPKHDLDGNVLCRICVRLLDGRKVERNFIKTESVQLLWSFCYSQIDEKERTKRFKLIQAFPGSYKTLYYGSNTTFDQSGLANSLVSVTWA